MSSYPRTIRPQPVRPSCLPSLTCAGALLLSLFIAPGSAEAKAYKGAEVYSSKAVLYGRMEMRMRMIRGSGLVSTFFGYKNGSELAGAAWEEIDMEVLGKNNAVGLQTNLITGNPRTTSEKVYTAAQSLADDYHTYRVDWTPEYVAWSLDGTEVRRTEGGQAAALSNAQSLRFNAWSSESTGWVGELDESALPAYQFVNWIKYYRYEDGQFVLDWTDDFDTFDASRWAKGNWSFGGNRVDFDPANAVVQDGTLILAITKEGETGFAGTVPADSGIEYTAPTATPSESSEGGCRMSPSGAPHHPVSPGWYLLSVAAILGLAGSRNKRRR